MGERVYRSGRAAFLRSILDEEAALFHSAWARDLLEDPARANLRRDLKGIAS